eukprot:Skav209490  [mRNA]  locus=scaffold1892:226779:227301:- [translate_table: standard]
MLFAPKSSVLAEMQTMAPEPEDEDAKEEKDEELGTLRRGKKRFQGPGFKEPHCSSDTEATSWDWRIEMPQNY